MIDPGRRQIGDPGVRRLQGRLAATDLVVILWATLGAQIIRFGTDASSNVALTRGSMTIDYTAFSLGLAALWWVAIRLHGGYSTHTLGHGAAEYRAVIVGTLRVFAALAMLAFAFQVQVARGYILLALPAGLVGLMVARRMWRRWLGGQREVGRLSSDVLVVGDEVHAPQLVEALGREPAAGYVPVGVCCTSDRPVVAGLPVLGAEHDAARVAIELGVDVVACGTSARLGSAGLRRLSWALEGSGIALVVAPGLTEIAGPRVLARPVAGLPLLHVEAPTFSGPRLVLKAALDWLGALMLLIAFSPVMLGAAVAIRLHDGGPILFRQTRVGLDGRTFTMTKFRSMSPDSEARQAELQDRQREVALERTREGSGDVLIDRGLLFKMENDPRVTPVGRFIRRYSIDELPQLFDVLAGKMSLVGPRPPLPAEVSTYADDVRRRLLVKPGMTGLWQINGRSDLSWEESVRFDLYYVENWSVAQDLIILWRTAAAVVAKRGAY